MLSYAGIGSRETPADILELMTNIARELHDLDFTLYSGAANGADTAFYLGSGDKNRIYVPWEKFNNFHERQYLPIPAAFTIASLVHPAWNNLSYPAQKLMARNSHQVLREDLASPVKFVVCWTVDGAETTKQRSPKTGGTGQAIDLASRIGIPVVNLANHNAMDRLNDLLQEYL